MKRLAFVLSLSTGLGVLLTGGTVQADKLKDITCEQYLAMDEAQQDDIVYWISGVGAASSKKEVDAADIEVGYDKFGQPVAAVVTACEADKTASLWETIKKRF